jgi:hypothetical protein
VLAALSTKAAAPFEPIELPQATLAAIDAYERHRVSISALSLQLQACNPQIAIVKERAAGADVATLAADLAGLNAIKQRHDAAIALLSDEYLAEKAAKTATEALRVAARTALDQYRQNIFRPISWRSTPTCNGSTPAFGLKPWRRSTTAAALLRATMC